MQITFWTVGSFALTSFQLLGLWKQSWAVWKMRSGKSLSLVWISYFLCLYIAQSLYAGIRSEGFDIPLFVNGILQALILVTILLGILRYQVYPKNQKIISSIFFLCPFVLLFVPQHSNYIVFTFISAVGIVSTFIQVITILKQGRGVVSINLLVANTVMSAFWVTYAYTTNEPALKIVTPLYLVVFSLNIIFWTSKRQESIQTK